MKKLLGFLLLIAFTVPAEAQILKRMAEKAGKAAERTVERRIEKETSKKTDEALDKVLEGGKNKNDPKNTGTEDPASAETSPGSSGSETATRTFASYGKFDFIPGEKVIVLEDFAQDAVGDFPAKWNTNASGEIKVIDGNENKWLALTTKGAVTPEFVTELPENFTLEFDLAVTPGYSYYSSHLSVSIANLGGANGFTAWSDYGRGKTDGVVISLHPQDAGSAPVARSHYELWSNGKKTMNNSLAGISAFNNKDKNVVRVSIWRQNQRLRMYIDESKIWDLPRAFTQGTEYNGLVFSRGNTRNNEEYYISNVRLAVGAPDTRNKLITEGKFVTTGIYFNSGSATIKPESYGVMKEIATVLKENPSVRVSIIGHTDSDGSDDLNLKLSLDRAASVKAMLSAEFGIDADRMTTDGKGENEPVGNNTITEGKAQNRRVEFIRL